MDLKLSTSLQYGLSALTYLACAKSDRPVMVREICRECGLPYDSTMKVMRQLTRARLVNAHRGSKGGFSLRVAPHEITFLRIIEAVEGPIETGGRQDGHANDSVFKNAVRLLNDARQAVEHVYRSMTLQDLAGSQN